MKSMNIVGALKVINRMKADGVIQSYAIGGAVGATFYLEPIRTLEHLAAIALETGRVKDTTRLLQFLQAGALTMSRFESIVDRNGLSDRWTSFQGQHPLEKK
jgi:hypothetical protein